MILFEEYGDFGPLVRDVVSLMAAIGAIGLAWRGRTKWEPSEEDVAKGPQKVGAVFAAVVIVALWVSTRGSSDDGYLAPLAIGLGLAAIVSLCLYGVLITMQTYTVPIDKTRARKVIGGFRLTDEAKHVKEQNKVTTQEAFAGAAYDFDKVWTRASRAVAKMGFVLCYLGLTVSGTIAIASAAMMLD